MTSVGKFSVGDDVVSALTRAAAAGMSSATYDLHASCPSCRRGFLRAHAQVLRTDLTEMGRMVQTFDVRVNCSCAWEAETGLRFRIMT